MSLISPEIASQLVAVTASPSTTGEIKFQARGGQVFIPNGSSITSLTWYAAEKSGGTFLAAYSEDGAAPVVQTGLAANRSYPIPAALFGASALKAVGNTSGNVLISQKG